MTVDEPISVATGTDENLGKSTFTRQELYALVWAEPMLKVAEKLRISSSYMARVCTLMNVPRPHPGYWAKVQVGKAPARPELPDARPGDELFWSKGVTLVSAKNSRSLVTQTIPEAPPKTSPPTKGLHPLISGAKAHFENSRKLSSFDWYPRYLKPYKQNLVDVVATKEGLAKALQFANDLFNALEARKHRVVLGSYASYARREHVDEREVPTKSRPYTNLWSPGRSTVATFGTVEIGLCIIEMSEEVKGRVIKDKFIRDVEDKEIKGKRQNMHVGWETTRTVPSGRLRLMAYASHWRGLWKKEWQETTEQDLISRIPEIINTLEAKWTEVARLIAEGERQAEEERRKWEEQLERSKRKAEEERVTTAKSESLKELLQIMATWAEAKRIEAFFDEISRSFEGIEPSEREALNERLALARQLVCNSDALAKFISWSTPEERLKPTAH